MWMRLIAAFALCASSASIGLAATHGEKKTVRFEIRAAEFKPAPGLKKVMIEGTGKTIYLHKRTAITNKHIASAKLSIDGNNKPVIEVIFTDAGKKLLAKLTAQHQGKPLAIIINGKVVSAPIVRQAITEGRAIVNGTFSKKTAQRWVDAMNAN